MTNQEIEKRFLFDLEMGVFRAIDNVDYTWFISTDEYGYKTICELLDNIGFTTFNYYNQGLRYATGKVVYIGIQVKHKKYSIYIRNIQLSDIVVNSIPEYVKEYSICKNW